jgi:phenylalanyl-tRNA synthetase beta subunit
MIEIDLDGALALLPEPTTNSTVLESVPDVSYRAFSRFPFIVRDIALWVPATVSEDELARRMREKAGPLVVRFSRFDRFQKEGDDRVSYAFRLVFQSFDRTLTDEEVNEMIAGVTEMLAASGYEVR